MRLTVTPTRTTSTPHASWDVTPQKRLGAVTDPAAYGGSRVARRITILEIFKHPFFRKDLPSDLASEYPWNPDEALSVSSTPLQTVSSAVRRGSAKILPMVSLQGQLCPHVLSRDDDILHV